MSPRESAVKISGLAAKPQKLVNDGENEAGTHKMLSQTGVGRLHIARCDSKDSVAGAVRLFLVNGAQRHFTASALARFITIWL